MSKMIAVTGAPGSGKTTFSVKLAETLYSRSRGKSSVIVVFTDNVTPTIPVVFPNHKSEEIFSIGAVLSKPDFFADDIASNIVMTKGKMNLGFLGYKEGENIHSYPTYTKAKAKYFYEILSGITDYVIVDCMSLPDANHLTSVALEQSDRIIRLSTPELKCISFQISQHKLFATMGYIRSREMIVMNIPRQELTLAAQDAKSHLGKVTYSLPYSALLMEQYMEGNMALTLKDKRYTQIISEIAEGLV